MDVELRIRRFNPEADGGVETLTLPPIAYAPWEIETFRGLVGLLRRAVEQRDPRLLGRVATASTVITQRHRPKRLMPELLQLAEDAGAAGVQVAHSGTVAGLLFDPADDAEGRMERARAELRRLGLDDTWEFTTELEGSPAPAARADGGRETSLDLALQ